MTYNHVHYHTIQHSSEYYRPATPNAAIKKIQPVSQRYAHLRLQTAWASRPRFPRSSSFLFLFIVVEIQFLSISVPLQFQFNSSPTSISIQSESSPPPSTSTYCEPSVPSPSCLSGSPIGPPFCRSRRLLCGQRDLFFPSPYPISPSL